MGEQHTSSRVQTGFHVRQSEILPVHTIFSNYDDEDYVEVFHIAHDYVNRRRSVKMSESDFNPPLSVNFELGRVKSFFGKTKGYLLKDKTISFNKHLLNSLSKKSRIKIIEQALTSFHKANRGKVRCIITMSNETVGSAVLLLLSMGSNVSRITLSLDFSILAELGFSVFLGNFLLILDKFKSFDIVLGRIGPKSLSKEYDNLLAVGRLINLLKNTGKSFTLHFGQQFANTKYILPIIQCKESMLFTKASSLPFLMIGAFSFAQITLQFDLLELFNQHTKHFVALRGSPNFTKVIINFRKPIGAQEKLKIILPHLIIPRETTRIDFEFRIDLLVEQVQTSQRISRLFIAILIKNRGTILKMFPQYISQKYLMTVLAVSTYRYQYADVGNRAVSLLQWPN